MRYQENNVTTWAKRIKAAYALDETVIAYSLAEQAIAQTNNDPEILEIAGMLAFDRGELNLAKELIQRAMFEVSLSVSSQLVLAEVAVKDQNHDEAKLILEFLVEIADRVPCSLLPRLTHLLSGLRMYQLALAICREAFRRHPEDDNAVFGVAFYMYRAGYPLTLVHNVMARAVEMKPHSSLYRINLAAICCYLEQWQVAYDHACEASDATIRNLPCQCMATQMKQLFLKFDDHARLKLLEARTADGGAE